MNYSETLSYLFEQLPMYQRQGASAYKANLDTTYDLLEALGNPQKGSVKFIHVAGTNGKGSVSHMLASILQEAGFKTGLFTSPHLKDFRERIKIDGQIISEEIVIDFVAGNSTLFEQLKPSFFEMTAGLAFQVFNRAQVEIAILETGMGGRLDSTNVVDPMLSIITNIGLDHTQFLGDSIEKVATEKAGIIKPNRPVVTGPMRSEALGVISEIAKVNGSLVYEAQSYDSPWQTDLKGTYQKQNLRTVTASLAALSDLGIDISPAHIRTGLLEVVKNTGLLGRWQTLSEQPHTICDVAHNVDGLTHVLQQIEATPYQNLHFVFGMVGDKNVSDILSMLPKDASYYFCAAAIPRAMNAEELQKMAILHQLVGQHYSSVSLALETARKNATANDLIFVGGSVFVVAEVV